MSEKAALFWNNKIASATLTASSAAITQNNLKTYQLGEKWRTTSQYSQWVHADFTTSQYLPVLFIWAHNLTASATVRVRISANSDMSSPVYDVTFYAWPSIVGYDEDVYDGDEFVGYDGKPIVENLQPFQLYSIFVLSDTSGAITVTTNDETYYGRYMRVDINDPANPDSYIQAGYMAAGAVFQPTYDIDLQHVISWNDPSQIITSYSQTLWINKRNKFRTLSASFNYLSEKEARSDWNNILANTGGSKPVIFMPYFENSFRSYATTIYGILSSEVPIQQVRQKVTHYSYSVGFNIRELI